MAFKSLRTYNEERYGGLFRLVNDGDSADVIFLYRNVDDVLTADTHYIKSAEYSGYIHCNGRGCPACGKNIRVQQKLFIPVYNLTANEIQFWDRNIKFETQLLADVFDKFPNPCEYVFKIIRHGVANDINTIYEITVVGRNSQESYDQILARFNIKMPDHYETIVRDVDTSTLSSWLAKPTDSVAASTDLPDYSVTPRTASSSVVPPVYEEIPKDTMLPPDDVETDDPSTEELDDVSF